MKSKQRNWTLKSNTFPRKRSYRTNLVATCPRMFGLQILLPLLFPVPCHGGESQESICPIGPSEAWSHLSVFPWSFLVDKCDGWGGRVMSKSHMLSHEQEVTDFGFSFNLLGGCSGAPFFFFPCSSGMSQQSLACFSWSVASIETVLLYILYCTHS